MKLHILICFTVCIQLCLSDNDWNEIEFTDDPDKHLNATQLIESKGYPAEEYTVQTSDGYLLGMQRIPHGRSGHSSSQKKGVVLMMHGLLSCSTDFIVNFPEQSLGFILADAGYDVWLGNVRGNTYSRRHVNYTTDSKEFWSFSFDEMGEHDLPAMIDYVLNATGVKQIYYVGHSQGTTIQFVLLSTKPEYNEKIKLFVALAPAVRVDHMTSGIRYLIPFEIDLEFFLELLGQNELLPNNAVIKYLSGILCETEARFVCENIIFLFCGSDVAQLNQTRLGVYINHSPAGTSLRSFHHFVQLYKAKKFQKYDFGRKGNCHHYNQTTPPEYYVGNVTAKVALFWSEGDALADPRDVLTLESHLKSVVASVRVNFSKFNHLDFVWGVDANRLLYDDVLSVMSKH